MKKLIDDAKEKAQEAKEQAANKAQEALVEATIGVAKRKAGDMVTDLLEGVVGAAEESLAAAEAAAGVTPVDGEADDRTPEEIAAEATRLAQEEADRLAAEEAERARVAQEKADRAAAELARLKAELSAEPSAAEAPPAVEEVSESVDAVPAPSPLPEPLPPRALRDPYSTAEAALRRAREARGLEPEDFQPRLRRRDDPMAAARDALQRAAEARGTLGSEGPSEAASGSVTPSAPRSVDEVLAEAAAVRALAKKGLRAQAREDAARAELERMKRGMGLSADSNGSDEDEPDAGDPPTTKKRRL